PGIDAVLEGRLSPEGGIPAPVDLLLAARQRTPPLAPRIEQEIRRFRPRLVVNQIRTRADLDLGPALRAAGRRALGLAVDYLGHLETDDAVWLAVRKRRPLAVEHPESKVSKNIERIVRKLLAAEGERPTDLEVPRTEAEYNLYDVLETDPGASDEELRRCYRRVREIYAPESMAMCGLYSPERIALLGERIQEAYDTLLDTERRRQYDLKLWPEGPPVRRGGAQAAGRSGRDGTPLRLPPEPPLAADTRFSGELLRQVREARGIELEDISNRTKIHIGHLRSIENERFDILPARVYLRGFLVEFAKVLRLDPQQVVKTYLERYDALVKPED